MLTYASLRTGLAAIIQVDIECPLLTTYTKAKTTKNRTIRDPAVWISRGGSGVRPWKARVFFRSLQNGAGTQPNQNR